MIPTCGARTRGTGEPCQRYPCKNGRCHLHGGKSTGPKTKAGRRKCGRSSYKHGMYSTEAQAERRRLSAILKKADNLIEGLN